MDLSVRTHREDPAFLRPGHALDFRGAMRPLGSRLGVVVTKGGAVRFGW